MKIINIITDKEERKTLSESFYKDLNFIFGNYAKVNTYFFDKLKPSEKLEGDIHIIMTDNKINLLKTYVDNLDKVIVVSRTIKKIYLKELYNIPVNSNVLVVNDNNTTTIETVRILYQLGIDHLNLIPFNNKIKFEKRYKDISIAISPNELDKVPKFINKIVDIGHRCIDSDTVFKIKNTLGLDNEIVNRNIIIYLDSIAEARINDISEDYKYNLNRYIIDAIGNEIDIPFLVSDSFGEIIYINKRVWNAFSDYKYNKIEEIISKEQIKELIKEKTTDICCRNGSLISVKIKEILVIDKAIAYIIYFREANTLYNKNIDFIAKYSFEDIIHSSDMMKKTISMAKKVSNKDLSVLLLGETGTGKELFAQSIHNGSMRKDKPFIPINCSSIPENLLESELFGYSSGSFTGANKKGKKGLFEIADGGTIFLDEIGDMPKNLQSKLLRVIQDKKIRGVGGLVERNIDVRFISATNKNLEYLLQSGEFRRDLFYRICEIKIDIPSLNKRGDDIHKIGEYFIGSKYKGLLEIEKLALEYYSWEGNIREFKNTLNYYSVFGSLPENIINKYLVSSGVKLDEKFKTILKIIKINTQENKGIGKISIKENLEKYCIYVSDFELRKILKILNTLDLIYIGIGNQGTSITKEGINVLESYA